MVVWLAAASVGLLIAFGTGYFVANYNLTKDNISQDEIQIQNSNFDENVKTNDENEMNSLSGTSQGKSKTVNINTEPQISVSTTKSKSHIKNFIKIIINYLFYIK